MGWNHQLVERWWTVYFYFWKHGINFNLPKSIMNKNAGEIPATWTAGGGPRCFLWLMGDSQKKFTQSNKWRLLSLGSCNFSWIPFLKHIQLMVPSGLIGYPMDFGTPATGETCHGHIPWSRNELRQVAPATWAEKVGFRGGRNVRGDGKGWSKFERSDDYWGAGFSFKHFFLCSPRVLGKWFNLTSIFFKWVGSTTNETMWFVIYHVFFVRNWIPMNTFVYIYIYVYKYLHTGYKLNDEHETIMQLEHYFDWSMKHNVVSIAHNLVMKMSSPLLKTWLAQPASNCGLTWQIGIPSTSK